MSSSSEYPLIQCFLFFCLLSVFGKLLVTRKPQRKYFTRKWHDCNLHCITIAVSVTSHFGLYFALSLTYSCEIPAASALFFASSPVTFLLSVTNSKIDAALSEWGREIWWVWNVYCRSKLHLVDLAGSERCAKTGVAGSQLAEAKCINLSLHHLEGVIIGLQHDAGHKSIGPWTKSRIHSFYRPYEVTVKWVTVIRSSPDDLVKWLTCSCVRP